MSKKYQLVVRGWDTEKLANVLMGDEEDFEKEIKKLRMATKGKEVIILEGLTDEQMYQICVNILMYCEDDIEPTGVYESLKKPYLKPIFDYCAYVSNYWSKCVG